MLICFLLHHFCLFFCTRPLWCCFAVQLSLPCKLRCGFANPLFVVCLLFHIHLWCFSPVLSKWHFKSKSHYIKKCFWWETFPFVHPSKNWFTLNVFLHYLIFCKYSMFLLGLTVYEHPLLKCLMLAQFVQQIRCCRFPFFKLKNDPDAIDPQSGRSQIPSLSPTLPKMEKGCKHFYHVSPCLLLHRCVLYVLPSQKQSRLFQSQDFGLDGDWGVYLLLPPQTYLFILLKEGWRGRFAFIGAMVGGRGLWGGWLACSVHMESKNFGNSKFLQVVLILHTIQMMRIWNLHSTQKQDMQFRTWSKNDAESKDTFHGISNRIKNKILNKYNLTFWTKPVKQLRELSRWSEREIHITTSKDQHRFTCAHVRRNRRRTRGNNNNKHIHTIDTKTQQPWREAAKLGTHLKKQMWGLWNKVKAMRVQKGDLRCRI